MKKLSSPPDWELMPNRRASPRGSAGPELQEEMKQVLLSRYTPAAVLVDDSLTVMHAHGPVSRFLERPAGAPTANLVKMAKWGLADALRSAVRKAKAEGIPVSKGVVCDVDGAEVRVRIDVRALRSAGDRGRRYLVLFKPAPPLGPILPADESPDDDTLLSMEEFRAVREALALAKEKLQATNDDLDNLLAGSQIPVVMVDRGMRIRRYSLPAERALGLIPSDVGQSITRLKLNIEAPKLAESLREVIDGSFLAKQLEVRDGQDRWHCLRLRPYKTAAGAIDGAVLSMLDINDKRLGMRALEASRDYAQAIVDTVHDSLLILDRHLKVKQASRFYYKLFKESPAEIEGKSIYELGKGRWNISPLRRHLSALAAHKTPFNGWEGEFELPKLGRRTLTISGSLVPHDIKGEMSIVLAIEDVSLRKQAAEAAVLRKSEARQRDFVANVSHELMTPITAIKGYSESLVAGALEIPGKRVKFAQIIEKHADRLAQLVEDLLQLSSYDAGRVRAASEKVPLKASVERLVRGMAPVARKRLVSVRVQISQHLKVAMNRSELNQVLQNLCENAIKYNRRKGRVYIRARKIGKRAVVSVQDSGIGIPREDLPRIFDRFHRAENARLKTGRGNGLGLSIARAILINRGCRIWAESVEDKGTIIHFTLPLAVKRRR